MAVEKVFNDYEVGEVYHSVGRTVTHSDIRMYIGATDASHPNHINSEYASDHPSFDDIVVPGVLTLGLADAFTAKQVAGPAAYAMNYGYAAVQFLGPVYVGDTISGEMEITGKEEKSDQWGVVDIDVELANQDDETVLVLEQMIAISTSTTAIES